MTASKSAKSPISALVYQRFQHALLQLKRRGVILAICSKNDEANVRRVLAEHPDMVLREALR